MCDLFERVNSAVLKVIEAAIADNTAYLLAERKRQSNRTNPDRSSKREQHTASQNQWMRVKYKVYIERIDCEHLEL